MIFLRWAFDTWEKKYFGSSNVDNNIWNDNGTPFTQCFYAQNTFLLIRSAFHYITVQSSLVIRWASWSQTVNTKSKILESIWPKEQQFSLVICGLEQSKLGSFVLDIAWLIFKKHHFCWWKNCFFFSNG